MAAQPNPSIQERLRKVIGEVRRKPYPIKDLIPLLDEAATKLEQYDNNSNSTGSLQS